LASQMPNAKPEQIRQLVLSNHNKHQKKHTGQLSLFW
jgi:hypothetical protein